MSNILSSLLPPALQSELETIEVDFGSVQEVVLPGVTQINATDGNPETVTVKKFQLGEANQFTSYLASDNLAFQVGKLIIENIETSLSGKKYTVSFNLESSNGLSATFDLVVKLLSEEDTNAKR